MENLDRALAGLASQLGVSVSQLWDWMQGYGIQAYARARIAQLAPIAVVGAIFLFIMVSLPIYLLLKGYKKQDKIVYVNENAAAFTAIMEVILFFASILTVPCLCELLGWIASPEGMVIETLMEAL